MPHLHKGARLGSWVGAGLETFGIVDVMAGLLRKAFFVVSVEISWYI